MFEIDEWMTRLAGRLNINISRYADDITVSGEAPAPLRSFERKLRIALDGWKNPNLRLNEKKTGLYGRGQKRMVTGLIITPEERVSIGRERKRAVSSQIHKFRLGLMEGKPLRELRGMIAFIRDVEPTFYESMQRKYGVDVLERLQRID